MAYSRVTLMVSHPSSLIDPSRGGAHQGADLVVADRAKRGVVLADRLQSRHPDGGKHAGPIGWPGEGVKAGRPLR